MIAGKSIFISILCLILLTGCGSENRQIDSINSSVYQDYSVREQAEKTKPESQIELEGLQAQNQDVIGIIQIPETMLDYPLMYRDGEEEYYLRRNMNEEYDIAGLPFMQQGCSLNQGNIFVYGHYFKTGEMFGCLHNYIENEDYYESHPDIYLTTSTGTQKWRIVAVSVLHTEDNGFVYNDRKYFNFETESEFDTFMTHIWRTNATKTGQNVEYGDRLMILSTCYDYSGSSKRVVACAKQIE